MRPLLHSVWLSMAVTCGSDTYAKLLLKFPDAKSVYDADEESLISVIGSKSKDLSALCDKDLSFAEKTVEFCERKGIGILLYTDDEYPDSLRKIKNPPVLLYYRGILPNFNRSFLVSVVGTRRLSDYGRKNAFSISYDLARSGATVVSGMAIGVDGVSHAGALAAGGATIAVLGSGIDVCYPKQHQPLAREIVKSGCVFTEFPPGTKPEKHNFPVRNRIISGLSGVTLVVEGRARSGALITARCANEQGRALYAIPGNVGNANSELTNLLIQNGASLCTSADDIVRDFGEKSMGILNPFILAERAPVNMNEALLRYSVAAVAPEDKIFRSPIKRNEKKKIETGEQAPDVAPSASEKSDEEMLAGFDSLAIRIYKKIPIGKECAVESLIEPDLNMRVVMKSLLKLEMARFVVMLPGEKVRRNLK